MSLVIVLINMQKLFKDFFCLLIQEKRNNKEEKSTYLCLELKQHSMILQLVICSDSYYYWRTLGRYRPRRDGRSWIGYTYVLFLVYNPPRSYRRNVNDCRSDFGCFLYASGRRTGLYGETGRTLLRKNLRTSRCSAIGDLSVHLYCRNRACSLFRIARDC